jgi:hypothetical protein
MSIKSFAVFVVAFALISASGLPLMAQPTPTPSKFSAQAKSRLHSKATEAALNPQPLSPKGPDRFSSRSKLEQAALNPQPLPPKGPDRSNSRLGKLDQVALNPQPLLPKSTYRDKLGKNPNDGELNPQPLPPKNPDTSRRLYRPDSSYNSGESRRGGPPAAKKQIGGRGNIVLTDGRHASLEGGVLYIYGPDGKVPTSEGIYVTKDGRTLVVGNNGHVTNKGVR